MSEFAVVVPWHNEQQRNSFVDAWGVEVMPEFLLLQHDERGEGCAATKNKGVARAIEMGAEVIVVLDDDCYPTHGESYIDDRSARGGGKMRRFAEAHIETLKPRKVLGFGTLTDPPSRGTPYGVDNRDMRRDVAASMGYWTEIGDYCAVRQLVHGGAPMEPLRAMESHLYFPLSGMNMAFRPKDWMPWATFIDVSRYDDIWMGWLWQKEAYRRGAVFALDGPKVRHSRQSNIWANLQHEARFAEVNETLWREIAQSPHARYEVLRQLLPV